MFAEDLSTIPRLYTGIAEWACCMVYIVQLPKRFSGVKFIVAAIAALGLQIGWQQIAGNLPLWLWIPSMFGAVILMFAFIGATLKINLCSAVGWCVYSFIFAEFLASCAWQTYYYIAMNHSLFKNVYAQIIILILIYILGLSLLFFLEFRYLKHRTLAKIEPKDLIVTIGIVVLFFTLSNISFISLDTPFSGTTLHEIFYIRTLVDFCAIVLLFALREQKLWHRTQANLDAIETILERQYEQYIISKESIDIINRKYHDMKNIISVVRAEKDSDKKNEYLKEIENDIKFYEAQNKTGNKILDTIITSKALVCTAKDIQFTCIADGKLLDFMSVSDICSIFGNALDNAIESARNITESSKRLIKVAVYRQNKFLLIRFENYYENDLKFENGSFLTTKDNKDFHGFGIKSIKRAAERYGGTITVTTDNNWFLLVVLIPF